MIFLVLSALFMGVTELLRRAGGGAGERTAGYEPDPYHVMELWVIRGAEAAVAGLAARLSAAEGAAGLPQTALAMGLFLLGLAVVAVSQVRRGGCRCGGGCGSGCNMGVGRWRQMRVAGGRGSARPGRVVFVCQQSAPHSAPTAFSQSHIYTTLD